MRSVQSMILLEKYKSAESLLRQIGMTLQKALSVEISEPLHNHVKTLLDRAGQDKSRVNAALGLSGLVFEMYRLYSEARIGLEFYQQALVDTC